MSTRNHAHTRGQRHQWRVGLTAWTVYGERRLWAIVGTLRLWMVLSLMSCVSTVSSAFLPAFVCMAGLRHAIEAEVLGLLASLCAFALWSAGQIILCPAFPIRGFFLQHVRENVR